MRKSAISRRDLMMAGGAALAGVAFLRLERLVAAAPLQQGEVVLPWLDQPAEVPPPAQSVIGQQLVWEELDSWITPNDKFFTDRALRPADHRLAAWRLEVDGLVKQPLSLTLDRHQGAAAPGGHLHHRVLRQPRPPVLTGGIGNADLGRHAARRRCCRRPASCDSGIEVVFWGTDIGEGRQVARRRSCSSTSRAACRSPTRWTRTTCSATR